MEYLCCASQSQTKPDLQVSWRVQVFSATEGSTLQFHYLYFNCFSPFLGMLSADEDLVSSAVSMPVFNMWLLQFCNSTVDFTVLYIWFCDLSASNQDNAKPKKLYGIKYIECWETKNTNYVLCLDMLLDKNANQPTKEFDH
jgi:hypothetical protein